MIDAARPSRHVAGDRWFVDETYLKVAGQWVYLYRAIDQHGQVIDVLASPKRDLAATRRFFARALNAARRPTEVTTDRAPAYPRVLNELVPEAWHVVEQYANNPIEADHGRLKARTRPMRGLKRIRSAQVVCSGMRSFRTCAVDTTNSASIPSPAAGSRRSSPNSPSPSEQRLHPSRLFLPSQRNSAAARTSAAPPSSFAALKPPLDSNHTPRSGRSGSIRLTRVVGLQAPPDLARFARWSLSAGHRQGLCVRCSTSPSSQAQGPGPVPLPAGRRAPAVPMPAVRAWQQPGRLRHVWLWRRIWLRLAGLVLAGVLGRAPRVDLTGGAPPRPGCGGSRQVGGGVCPTARLGCVAARSARCAAAVARAAPR